MLMMAKSESAILFSLTCVFLLSFGCQLTLCSAAIRAISPSTPLKDGENLTLTSPQGNFEMGFFDAGYPPQRYVGIWSRHAYDARDRVLWVANRDKPLADNMTGVIAIRDDGNLAIFSRSDSRPLWSTATGTSSSNNNTTVAKLLDNGNLLLLDSNSSTVLWQSFDHPYDTLLPGMKIGIDRRRGWITNLTSVSYRDSQWPGMFIFGIDQEGLNQFFVWKRSEPWWRVISQSIQDGSFSFLPLVAAGQYNLSEREFEFVNKEEEVYFTLKYEPGVFRKLQLDSQGQLLFYAYTESDMNATLRAVFITRQEKFCSYDTCGTFTVCDDKSSPPTCRCLPGFEPLYSKQYSKSWVYDEGCKIKTPPQCGQDNSSSGLGLDHFLGWSMQISEASWRSQNITLNECKELCLQDCTCVVFAVEWKDGVPECHLYNRFSGFVTDDNNPVYDTELYYVRTAASQLDVGPCERCGTTAIPHPLSIASNCGEPTYRSFHCDNSTGQLFFNTSDGASYPVSFIDEEAQTFIIQPTRPCWPGSFTKRSSLLLNTSLPFYLTEKNTLLLLDCANRTLPKPLDCSSSSMCHRYIKEAGAPCLNQQRCCSHVVRDTTTMHAINPSETGCSAYMSILPSNLSLPAYNWREGIEIGWHSIPTQQQYQGKKGSKVFRIEIIIPAAITMTLVVILAVATYKRRKLQRERGQGVREQHDSLWHSSMFNDWEHEVDVPLFSFDTIAIATKNFSDSNKLGKGGFGPVYKGKLEGGPEIAVKRLSRTSGQGLAEFMNEVKLIAKLQHRNLVRLLGYCIQDEEKLLIYEYMPNTSLDFFLFDSDRGKTLNWEKRYAIIMGVARGLLYLHQDSRLRIIHRDLKTSNILLDNEMNPKISDFGLARSFGGNENHENTNKIVGTYGYMSPEYASHGFFSTKSDVFSFGVIILEIISGLKNSRFCQSNNYSTLLGHAWQLWIENKAMHLVDPLLRESCNANEVLKCIQVGLLCVEENSETRPTMATVITLFSSESVIIPIPKKPAFYMGTFYKENSSTDRPTTYSKNEVTASLLEAR